MWGWWKKFLGDEGEREAARFLRRQRFRILARQYRSSHGEIDLIAEDGDWLVFVEVKTRRGHEAGAPEEAITLDKQRRLTRAATAFVQKRRLHARRTRFDVVAITWPMGSKQPQIQHYRHAFDAV